jgi:hypothetical protein
MMAHFCLRLWLILFLQIPLIHLLMRLLLQMLLRFPHASARYLVNFGAFPKSPTVPSSALAPDTSSRAFPAVVEDDDYTETFESMLGAEGLGQSTSLSQLPPLYLPELPLLPRRLTLPAPSLSPPPPPTTSPPIDAASDSEIVSAHVFAPEYLLFPVLEEDDEDSEVLKTAIEGQRCLHLSPPQ